MSLPKKLKQQAIISAAEKISSNTEQMENIADVRAQEIDKRAKKMYVEERSYSRSDHEMRKYSHQISTFMTGSVAASCFVGYGLIAGSVAVGAVTAAPFITMGAIIVAGTEIKTALNKRKKAKEASADYESIQQQNAKYEEKIQSLKDSRTPEYYTDTVHLISRPYDPSERYKVLAAAQIDQEIKDLSTKMSNSPKISDIFKVFQASGFKSRLSSNIEKMNTSEIPKDKKFQAG